MGRCRRRGGQRTDPCSPPSCPFPWTCLCSRRQCRRALPQQPATHERQKAPGKRRGHRQTQPVTAPELRPGVPAPRSHPSLGHSSLPFAPLAPPSPSLPACLPPSLCRFLPPTLLHSAPFVPTAGRVGQEEDGKGRGKGYAQTVCSPQRFAVAVVCGPRSQQSPGFAARRDIARPVARPE